MGQPTLVSTFFVLESLLVFFRRNTIHLDIKLKCRKHTFKLFEQFFIRYMPHWNAHLPSILRPTAQRENTNTCVRELNK